MENQTVLIATAGFALAGVAGYMYLNKSDDVVSENAKLGTTQIADLKIDDDTNQTKGSKTSWWNSWWANEYKQEKVLEELRENAETLYN